MQLELELRWYTDQLGKLEDLDDEIDALLAIYDEDFHKAEGAESSYAIYVHTDSSALSLDLNVSLPVDYPKQAPPIYELKNADWLSGDEKEHIARNFKAIYSEGKGEVVVYQWVEWLRDFIKGKQEEVADEISDETSLEPPAGMDQQTPSDPAPFMWAPPLPVNSSHEPGTLDIVHGEPLTDRKSTFQAHVAHVHSTEEVEVMLAQLKSNKKIAAATHNILAYRIYVSSRGVYQQDCDDDGEAAAGGRLLHLLQIMDVQNAAVVVTRWYGGIQLHADRFKHINNVARIAIQESGIGLQHLNPPEKGTSRKKRTKLKPKS